VTLRDFVADLAPLMDRSTALLAPLRWGSGIKLKVLVALAHGCPVLCSSVAAQGIVPSTSTQGVVVEDDLARWPEHMRRLAEPGSNSAHSAAARGLWAERYAPASAFQAYDEIFGLGAVV
jgi:glycosyltransferase involved in cell wall biosynthesis